MPLPSPAEEDLSQEEEHALSETDTEAEVDEELEAEEAVDAGVPHCLHQHESSAVLSLPLTWHLDESTHLQRVDQLHHEGEGLDDQEEQHDHQAGQLELFQGLQVQEVLLEHGLVGRRPVPPGPEQAEHGDEESHGDHHEGQGVLHGHGDAGPDVVHEVTGDLLDVDAHAVVDQTPGPEVVEVEADEEDGEEEEGGAGPLPGAQVVGSERVAGGDEQLQRQRHQ